MVDDVNNVESNEPSEQIAGRFVGMLVFLTGIAMLVVVFITAYLAFRDPGLIVPLSQLKQTPPPPPALVYLPAILKIILLFAMGYFGSLIAARGAQFFFSAKKEVRRAAGD
ncbi:MAG: hypothetical protein ACYDBB_00040 [Armatimonadota bacterium]